MYEILDQVKASPWKSPHEWLMKDTKLFLDFCALPSEVRRKVFPDLSDRFGLKLKPNASLGVLFSEFTSTQWTDAFRVLGIQNAKTPYGWALIQYRAIYGDWPSFLAPTVSQTSLDPRLSNEELKTFILSRSGPVSRGALMLFASKMEMERKLLILDLLAQNSPDTLDPQQKKKVQFFSHFKSILGSYQSVSGPEIRRVLDSKIEEGKKDVDSFPLKYLPILCQDVQEISVLYIRVKKGGLKPRGAKEGRPVLHKEILEGKELFRKMVLFFEIEADELDEFPFLEKVLRWLALKEDLYQLSNWPQAEEKKMEYLNSE